MHHINLSDPMPLLVCDKQTTSMLAQGKVVVVGEAETVALLERQRQLRSCPLVHRDAMQTLSWSCNCAYKWSLTTGLARCWCMLTCWGRRAAAALAKHAACLRLSLGYDATGRRSWLSKGSVSMCEARSGVDLLRAQTVKQARKR